MRPLFHAVRDETLVSLLPDDSFETIARHAIDAVADGLPFESEIIISPAGVPKIGGQHPAYIVKALQAYKSGERNHPSMRAIAATLSDKDMADLAAYYGGAEARTASK